MHEALGRYRAHLEEERRSPKTIQQYTWHAKRMLEWLQKDPAEVKPLDLSTYRHHLTVDLEYSKNSLYIATKALQDFFSYLGLDTADELTAPKRKGSLPKYLTEDEARKLLRAAEEDARDHAILVVLGYTGLRVSEACALRCEDIDLAERTLHVMSGKGDKDRIVVFENNTSMALRRWLENRGIAEHDALFVNRRGGPLTTRSMERLVRKYARAAGIQKTVTPHVMRHTLATTLLRRGADIRIIQQLLGHASVATTQIYTHVDDAMLKGAYDKAAPDY